MAGSTFGNMFRVSTFGESHGVALGVIVDGCPAGISISQEEIQDLLNRRRPGAHNGSLNAAVTARKEADECEILSGIFEGKTTGTPIAILIRNTSQHSKDYDSLKKVFRPGHADFTYQQKFGFRDYRGGGRASGRETASRVAAGAIAKTFLETVLGKNFGVVAYTLRAAGISCEKIDLSVIEQNSMRAADLNAAEKMKQRIEQIRGQGDSAGGLIECRIKGIPCGLGEPVFDKLDAEFAKAILSIGAVKGIEFGVGFDCVDMLGSEMNDSLRSIDGKCCFSSNNAGGILGGISNGEEIIFRVAVKPVPSIFKKQLTVEMKENDFENTDLFIEGRHDICLCPRIVPVIEAMSYITLADMYLRQMKTTC